MPTMVPYYYPYIIYMSIEPIHSGSQLAAAEKNDRAYEDVARIRSAQSKCIDDVVGRTTVFRNLPHDPPLHSSLRYLSPFNPCRQAAPSRDVPPLLAGCRLRLERVRLRPV